MSATLPAHWWPRRRYRKPPPAHGSVTTPTITTISPTSGAHNVGFTLLVNGTIFNSQTTIWFNGVQKTTKYNGKKQLQATLVAADVVTAGTYPVQVKSTNGQNSSSVNFTAT